MTILEVGTSKSAASSAVPETGFESMSKPSKTETESFLGKMKRLSKKLNITVCFYLGINHIIAIYALVILIGWGYDPIFYGGDTNTNLQSLNNNINNVNQNFLSSSKNINKDNANINQQQEQDQQEKEQTNSNTEQETQQTGPLYVKYQTLIFTLIMWYITGFGITGGAHRLWSHRSYEAHWTVRVFLMLINSMANQGSIFHWARDHRLHHRYSDTEKDPHNSREGFFWSHMGWLFLKKADIIVETGKTIDVQDLRDDPIVMFQHKLGMPCMSAFCFVIPALMCQYFWGECFWYGFLFPGVLRYVWVLHCTWCVNSITHLPENKMGGPTLYDPKEPPNESRLVAILAVGEGWHSWHHAFAFDYAASELGCWQQWNPTKFMIDLWAFFGLAWNRKRGHRMWNNRKEQMVMAKQKEAENKYLQQCMQMQKQQQSLKVGGNDINRNEFVDDKGNVHKVLVRMVESLEGPPMFKIRQIGWKTYTSIDYAANNDKNNSHVAVATNESSNTDTSSAPTSDMVVPTQSGSTNSSLEKPLLSARSPRNANRSTASGA